MSKNDYFVLVYKILSYLYKCLKSSVKPQIERLQPLTKDLPIEDSYWCYIFEKMVEDNFIENVNVICIDGESPIIRFDDNIRITPKGIEYLQDNSMMKKASKAIKSFKDIVDIVK